MKRLLLIITFLLALCTAANAQYIIGTGAPTTIIGTTGDYYADQSAAQYYGPKPSPSGTWPGPFVSIAGVPNFLNTISAMLWTVNTGTPVGITGILKGANGLFAQAILGTDYLASPLIGALNINGQTLQNTNVVQSQSITASVTGTYTVDLSLSNIWMLTLTGSTAITISNPPATGIGIGITLGLIQGGSGSYTVTFPGSTISWGQSSAPALSTSVGATDFINLSTINGGAKYYGTYSLGF